jgi:hypothetical protein
MTNDTLKVFILIGGVYALLVFTALSTCKTGCGLTEIGLRGNEIASSLFLNPIIASLEIEPHRIDPLRIRNSCRSIFSI